VVTGASYCVLEGLLPPLGEGNKSPYGRTFFLEMAGLPGRLREGPSEKGLADATQREIHPPVWRPIWIKVCSVGVAAS
jgi:hypothetical protein